jgi:hypothetical protein
MTLFFGGGEWSVFAVEIDEVQNVAILKEKINKKKLIEESNADKLTIFPLRNKRLMRATRWKPVTILLCHVPVEIRATYLKPEFVMDPTEDLEFYYGEVKERKKSMAWFYCH